MDKAATLKYSVVNKLIDSLTITNKSTKNTQRPSSNIATEQQYSSDENPAAASPSPSSSSSTVPIAFKCLRQTSSKTATTEDDLNVTAPTTTTTTTTIRVTKLIHHDKEEESLTIHSENIRSMHERLLEDIDDGGREAKAKKEKSVKIKSKLYREGKFTERLRRSFRRTEQNSFEVKRPEKVERRSNQPKIAATILKPLQQQLKNSSSIFSLTTNLPGICGHINPALLLDSPEQESTPPEYSYRHLNSVATTNSTTSLDSNICESPTTSFNYWAWHINQSNNNNNNSMGNDITSGINISGNSLIPSKNPRDLSKVVVDGSGNIFEEKSKENIKIATTVSAITSSTIKPPVVTESSRSCSTASDSSSTTAKLARLQNFLSSKSSNESSRSYQGHSNEGFTISSINSSSGEWENVYALSSTTPNLTIEEDEEELKEFTLSEDPPKKLESLHKMKASEAGNYYQYTLASPSNPFLPEITARTYHSTYEEIIEFRELDEELDANVTSVKYRIGSHSAQMPTPNYSRAGSQESTHSDGGAPYPYSGASGEAGGRGGGGGGGSGTDNVLYSQTLSSTSSTPGRHKRKLFSLSTPNKLNFPQQPYQQRYQQQQQQQSLGQTSPSPSPIALTAGNTTETTYASSSSRKSSTSSTSLGRNLNPFVSYAIQTPPTRTSSTSCLNKRNRPPLKQAAITSPIASAPLTSMASANIAKDVNARREEFLRATMQICLVVSPPSTRLQLKSKSLTHLDGLQTEMNCNHAKNTNNISSSEYFSVSFCTETSCQEEEFFPATKGVTLATALSPALRKRHLSLSKLIITDTNDNNRISNILTTGSTGIYSSLDEHTEVGSLAGHHLIITDKEGSRKTLQKANSFGSRARPPRLLSSTSTDESYDPNLINKQVKQRWSGLFGVKNPQQTQLCELLNNYAKNGVPQTISTVYHFDHPEQEDAFYYLDHMHKSWKDIIEYSNMTDNEIRIQTAIWELVTTEIDYIHCLQTVTDLFLACLEAIQSEGLLQDVDQYRLFANIRDICETNLKFWTFYLYPMVSHSIISQEHLHISFFQAGFIQFGQIFAPYKKYCAEQSSCQFYCKELNRTNSLFTSYLAWCESQKMCNRLRLADILVRPMQRLTKYSLLLAAIKKHLTNVEEIEAVDLMLHTTENFVFSVNNHLTTRQENERLKGVMARIESYDVVDTNNEHLDRLIKQNSQMFDLCGPMKGCAPHHVRHLFMEGDHKYKDNHGKIDVHCFLLTDMLLVCKSITKKSSGSLKIIRQPYLTDRLVIQHSHNVLFCVYVNEFQVATTAFSLHCSEAKNWYDAMKRAKMIYTRLKQCSLNNWDSNNIRYTGGGSIISGGTLDSLGISLKKSPMNSSMCSHVTSANNSHSGSLEWNDSRIISGDLEKTNSLSSDEGCSYLGVHGFPVKMKPLTTISPQKSKINPTSTVNSLSIQPVNHLGQSLPNLTLHHSHTNNTLAVPVSSNTTNQSGTLLLSTSHRGISYPPPSPTRVPLRRAMAFSSSIKNPPLIKTRNITSQSSINWHQISATATPTTIQSSLNQAINSNCITPATATSGLGTILPVNAASCNALISSSLYKHQHQNPSVLQSNTEATLNGMTTSLSLGQSTENFPLTDSTDI